VAYWYGYPGPETRQTTMDSQNASKDVAARPPRVNSPDRSQVDPNPRSLDELIPEGHEARTVWELTETLDMEPLLKQIKAVEGHPGRTPIDPRILVALWLYATIEGVASARRLAKLCYRDDPFKWIRGGVNVNHHTLGDFRVQHADWLKEQVTQLVAVMLLEGLITLNRVGQDGMRVRACAGSGSFKKKETLDKLLVLAQEQWDCLQKEFETGAPELSARQRAARERAARERLERLQRAKEEQQKIAAAREARKKEDGENARASFTDPESRKMKMADGGFRPAYNPQFATDLDGLVIVGAGVINAGIDGGQMDPMLEQIEGNQGQLPDEYYTDGGFSTKDDIEKVGQRGVTVFTPVKEEKKRLEKGKDPFAPQKGDKPKVAEWRQRMGTPEAKEKYKQRTKCEWTNAMCRQRNMWQFTVRGLAKVKAVVWWYVLAHNLLRGVALRAAQA